MPLSIFSCTLIFIALCQANDGLVLKETENKPENRPYVNRGNSVHENHVKGISDEDLRADLEIHDGDYGDYNWVQYDLLNKQLVEQFGQSDRTYIKEYYDARNENVLKAKITNPETHAFVTLATLPSRKVTIGTEEDHVKNKLEEAKENMDSTPENHLYGLKIGFRLLKEVFSIDTGSNSTLADAGDIGKALRVRAARIWRVALLWMSVYAVMAFPFWCVKGWCFCCLRCKFFKPQETIQEAKDYLLLNPPGVLVTKKRAIIHYEPTEREKDCYEEFGHFMRTL